MKNKFSILTNAVKNSQYEKWVILAFFISFTFFFVKPVFLNNNIMQFFNYVPVIEPIGEDLRQMLSYSNELVNGNSPYIGMNLYPPLASVFFTPLLVFEFSVAYKIITVISVSCFLFITFLIPYLLNQKQLHFGIITLIGITGLFSYGFHFELERGQFNIIATFFALLGIWIFQRNSKYKYIGLLFFCLAIQLKIYPFLFIFLLVNNLKDWKQNIKVLGILLLVNVALLFILGKNALMQFINAVLVQSVAPQNWMANHSIRSYVIDVLQPGQNSGITGTWHFSAAVQVTMLLVTGLFVVIVFLISLRAKKSALYTITLSLHIGGAVDTSSEPRLYFIHSALFSRIFFPESGIF